MTGLGTLNEVQTPAAILDLDRVEKNCKNMIEHAEKLGVRLRPHMKTSKSADLARLATSKHSSGITVSTLAEIEYFAKAGFDDITYGVGIVPTKMAAVAALQTRYGAKIRLLVDDEATAVEISAMARSLRQEFSTFIEIDCGAGRGGASPDGAEVLAIADVIERSHALSLAGVLTHAGQSYGASSADQIRSIAEIECLAANRVANRLRDAGHTGPYVSVGSTPTVIFASSMTGITDVRPGVYTLYDLDQVSLGVCTLDDVAMSVLATVIGHNCRSEHILIDAGALALSKDLSGVARGRSFGTVCKLDGAYGNSGDVVSNVHQEHGFIRGNGAFVDLASRYPIGSRVRILTNHACITAAPYEQYYLVRGREISVDGIWTKARGWSPSSLGDRK